MSTDAGAFPACPNKPSLHTDVAWLLHRAAQRMKVSWDEIARRHGLRDLRDWIVLTAIGEGEKRTQLSIGQELGLDKTTLTSVLDRLVDEGFVVRTLDPNDRRARIPELTKRGGAVRSKMAEARDKVDGAALSGFTKREREDFYRVLAGIAGIDEDDSEPVAGSCMR